MSDTLAPEAVRVPLAPFGLANAYLLGDVLVDAGFPWSRRTLAPLVRSGRVHEHALTHAHADHLSATPWLSESGVPVAIGARDAEALATGNVLTHSSALIRVMQRPLPCASRSFAQVASLRPGICAGMDSRPDGRKRS